MLPMTKGRYTARHATTALDISRAHGLRHLCFIANRGLVTTSDVDAHDADCQHILIEHTASATPVGCYRIMAHPTGQKITASYAAQFYDLSRLTAYPYPSLELGRFCTHPDHPDPDILRLAWAALTSIVDDLGIKLLFGCSSFDGADPARHMAALAYLNTGLKAPNQWRPDTKSPHVFPLHMAVTPNAQPPNHAPATLPPLLRTYLAMGGWVSDHAVIDTGLNTLHLFTGVEIDAIPPARARMLRALAT